jgi:hypothetical protein
MPYCRVLQPAVGIIPGNSRYLADIKLGLFNNSQRDRHLPEVILTDFLLFCCMAAFAIGVVIAAASIIG